MGAASWTALWIGRFQYALHSIHTCLLTGGVRIYYYSYTYNYYTEKLTLSSSRGILSNMRLSRLPAKADDTRNGMRNRNSVQNDHGYGRDNGNDLSSNLHCTRTQNPEGRCMEKLRSRHDQAMAPLIHHRDWNILRLAINITPCIISPHFPDFFVTIFHYRSPDRNPSDIHTTIFLPDSLFGSRHNWNPSITGICEPHQGHGNHSTYYHPVRLYASSYILANSSRFPLANQSFSQNILFWFSSGRELRINTLYLFKMIGGIRILPPPMSLPVYWPWKNRAPK